MSDRMQGSAGEVGGAVLLLGAVTLSSLPMMTFTSWSTFIPVLDVLEGLAGALLSCA